MKKFTILIVALFALNATAVFAQGSGMQRTGTVDAIYEGRIVINDVPYAISGNVVVNTRYSNKGTVARIRVGSEVGYRIGGGGVIVEIWLAPDRAKRTR